MSGTPTYIAPEQAQNPSQIDFRADMYSLGATCITPRSGVPVFIRPTAYDLLLAHIHEPPVHINDLDPLSIPTWRFVIHRMLQKRPGSLRLVAGTQRGAGHLAAVRDEAELLITQTSTGVDIAATQRRAAGHRSGESPDGG